jgi:hypothetical protein
MKSLLGLFLITTGLSIQGQEKSAGGILSDTSKVVILQPDSLYIISLSKEDIAVAENVFSKALEREFVQLAGKQYKKHKQQQKGVDIKRYQIQLVPRLNSKGELEVWVNCFCPLFFSFDWRNRIFSRDMVDDGGSCFFDLIINLHTLQYYHFGMNGMG